MTTETQADWDQFDQQMEHGSKVKDVTSQVAHLVGSYKERVNTFNQAVSQAEEICKTKVEPFLENLISNIKSQDIHAKLEIQKGSDDQEIHPRRVSLLIEQINGTEFTDINSTPTFLFICSGYKGGGINISSYAPNASRLDLGRIMNTSSDVEKELALIVVKGFERLFFGFLFWLSWLS